MSDKKYFPIKTDTACRLKWSWSTVYLNTGLTGSCHRASLSEVTPDNFFDFHNTERKLLDREQMLKGEWPGHGCEYCRDIESEGGKSDRQFQLTIPNEHPDNLNSDPGQVKTYPTTLEVFFRNTCNLACIYCKSTLSSRIESEDKKFGSPLALIADETEAFNPKGNYTDLVPLFWEWLDHGYSKLINLNVLGGEPLVQDDLYKLLDYINDNPNPNLTLNVITNLNVKQEILIAFIDRVNLLIEKRHLKSLMILASVECWGVEQEYIRYGFDCNTFDENMRYLLDQKHVKLNILSTVNLLSIPSMPVLANKVREWHTKKDIAWYTHLVLPSGEHVLSPDHLDFQIFQESLAQVVEIMESMSNKQTETLSLIEGIITKLKTNCKDNKEKQTKLINYLSEIDRRRGLNWKKVFPWLTKQLEPLMESTYTNKQ